MFWFKKSPIYLVIKQIGLPLRGRPILLITRMITDQIGLHSVLLPLLISLPVNPKPTIALFQTQGGLGTIMGCTTQDPHIQKEHIKLRENLKFGPILSKIQLSQNLKIY